MVEFSEIDAYRPLSQETGLPLDVTEGGTYVHKDPVYLGSSPIYYPPQPVDYEEQELPEGYGSIINGLINETRQEDEQLEIKDRETLDAYNSVFDEEARQKLGEDVLSIATNMAEKGVPAHYVSKWYRDQTARIGMRAKNSGLYSALVDARTAKMAEENDTVAALLTDPTSENIELANMVTRYMGSLSNIDIFNTKVAEANDEYDEQGLLTQIGKGYVTGATVPFINNINAFRLSGALKDVFGEDFERTARVNTLFENTRQKIYDAEMTMSPEEFKGFIDAIDKKLLDGTLLTLGDRKWFWTNLQNQSYRLNNLVFAGEAVGVLPSLKVGGLTMQALKGGASKAAVIKATTIAAMNEAVPGSGIAALGIDKMIGVPVRWVAFKGQRKSASVFANLKLTKSAFIDQTKHVKELDDIGRAAINSTGSGVSKALIGDAAIDISKTSPLKEAELIATSPYAKAMGLDKTREVYWGMVEADTLGQYKAGVDKALQSRFIQDILHKKESIKPFVRSSSSFNDKHKGFTTVLELGANDSNRGFVSKADAKQFMKDLNVVSDDFLGFRTIDSNPKVVERADGYFVTLERNYGDLASKTQLGDIAAVGIKEGFKGNKELRNTWSSNPWLNKLSTNLTIPHLQRTMNTVVQGTEGYTRFAMQDILRDIDKGKGPWLDTLMDLTKSKDNWLDPSYLKKKGVPEKVINAYDGMRQISDINYLFNGKRIITDLKELNMKNVFAGGQRIGLGRVVDDYDTKTVHKLIYDEGAQKVTTQVINNTKDIKKTHTVYEMIFPIDGEAKYVAIDNKCVQETLPSWGNMWMSYHPGRMNFTQGSGFIKQVKFGRGEKGAKWIDDISTIFSHPNQKSVKETAELLEDARQIAIKLDAGEITAQEAERLFQKLPNRNNVKYASFNQFYNLCGKDKLISLDPEAKLMYLADGQQLPDFINGVDARMYKSSGVSLLEAANSEKAISKAERKNIDILNPFNLDKAPRVSLEEEVGMEVEKIVGANMADGYDRIYADDFKKTFGQYLTGPYKDMDAKSFLLSQDLDKIIKDGDVLNMAKHAQETYMLVKGMPDKADKFMEDCFKYFANKYIPGWVAPEGSNMLELYKNFSKFNPIRKLRAFNFHFLLSFYNPRQLFIQAGAITNTMLLSPKASTQALAVIAPVMAYAMSGEKSMLVKAAKRLNVKTSYLEDLAEGAKHLDIWSKGSFGGAFDVAERGKIWDKISSTYFYDKGEFFNRFFAAVVTQQEYLNKGIKHGLLGLSPAEMMQATVRHQNLYMNMGRAGSSQIQRGFTGLITQFKGFPMRSIELLFDHTLTKAERRIFAAGQLLFGGMKGAFGRQPSLWIHQGLKSLGTPDYIADTMYNGILDQMIIDNDGHMSLGEFFSPQIADVVGLAIDGNIWENIPALQTLSRLSSGTSGAIAALAAYGRSGELTSNTFAVTMNIMSDLARKGALPGGPKNAMLGWWAWKTHKRLSSSGMLLDDGLNAYEAGMIGIGFKDPQRDQEAILSYMTKSRKEKVEELSKFIQENLSIAEKSPTSDMTNSRLKMLNYVISEYNATDSSIANEAYKKAINSWMLKDSNSTLKEKLLVNIAKSIDYDWAMDKLDKELKEATERAKEK